MRVAISGSFEIGKGSSIKICGQPRIDSEKNLDLGEIKDFPIEAHNKVSKQALIQNFGFHLTNTLYVLANNKIFKYKKERK